MNFWTEDRTNELRTLSANGMSARDIAETLHTTRNAIVGKWRRDKIASPRRGEQNRSRRKTNAISYPKDRARPKHDPKPKPPQLIPAPTEADAMIPQAQRCTIMDLTDSTCRWPIGNPGDKDFFFCGAPPRGLLPYCDHHMRAGYVPRSNLRR